MDKLTRFVLDYVSYVVKGSPKFYAWMGGLGVLIVIWAYGNYVQATEGLAITGLTSQVSDGLYLGNFVFLVGVAAAAVTIVFPAYVYHHKALHDVTVLGRWWRSAPSSCAFCSYSRTWAGPTGCGT